MTTAGGPAGADVTGGGAGVVVEGGAVVATVLVVEVVDGAVVGVGGAGVVLAGDGTVDGIVLVADLAAPQAVRDTAMARINVWRVAARTGFLPPLAVSGGEAPA